MTDQGVTYQQVPVSEAAAILGVSVMTVRRMIRRGQLEGERVHRPQGTAYVVTLPVDAPRNTRDAPATEQPPENVSRTNGTGPAPAEAMVSLIQTTIGTVLGPLVAELAASRQTNERQAERVAELERENGRLTAENRALEARTAAQNEDALRGAIPVPLARPRTVAAHAAGDRRGSSTVGMATLSPEAMSLLALAASALIVGVVCMAVWVWRRGWGPGEPPQE